MSRRRAAVVLALLAVSAAGAAPAAAASSTEEQRLAAIRCDGVPGAPGTPVLLIPGTGVNAEQNWSWGYARALRDAGHGVCTVDPPERSTVDVQDSVLYVRTAVEEVARRAGRRLSLIGHSQGAFHAVHVLRLFPELAPLVDDVVGLAGLYERGSDRIRRSCASSCPAAFRQVATGSRYMAALAKRPLPAGPSYTAIGTLFDDTVTPQPAVNALAGGRSVQIQDVCPGRRFVDGYDHIYLAADAVGYALAVDALDHQGPADPARVPRTTCMQQILPGADLVKLATLGPSLLQSLDTPYPNAAEEPPLRCPLADGCDAPAVLARVRLLSTRVRAGGATALAVRASRPLHLRLRFAAARGMGAAVTGAVPVRAGARRVRVALPRAVRPGLRRVAVEVRPAGATTWEVVATARLRVTARRGGSRA